MLKIMEDNSSILKKIMSKVVNFYLNYDETHTKILTMLAKVKKKMI